MYSEARVRALKRGAMRMVVDIDACPECGEDIFGMVEQVRVNIRVKRVMPLSHEGMYNYTGKSDIMWESLFTKKSQYKVRNALAQCRNNHEWNVHIEGKDRLVAT